MAGFLQHAVQVQQRMDQDNPLGPAIVRDSGALHGVRRRGDFNRVCERVLGVRSIRFEIILESVYIHASVHRTRGRSVRGWP